MTQQALHLLVTEELARHHLSAEHLVVSLSVEQQWHADLRVAGREFELGSAFHGGFYCRQTTPRGQESLLPPDARPLFAAPDLLVRCGVLIVRATLENRENEIAPPPAII